MLMPAQTSPRRAEPTNCPVFVRRTPGRGRMGDQHRVGALLIFASNVRSSYLVVHFATTDSTRQMLRILNFWQDWNYHGKTGLGVFYTILRTKGRILIFCPQSLSLKFLSFRFLTPLCHVLSVFTLTSYTRRYLLFFVSLSSSTAQLVGSFYARLSGQAVLTG